MDAAINHFLNRDFAKVVELSRPIAQRAGSLVLATFELMVLLQPQLNSVLWTEKMPRISTRFCCLLLGSLLGCQGGASRAAQVAKQGSMASASAAVSGVASQTSIVPTGCDEPNWPGSSAADVSGRPTAFVRHPSNWEVVVLEAGRIQMTPPQQNFQVIASTLNGPAQTDEQLRQLDEASVGQLPILSPWRRVEKASSFRVFTITRKTPQTNLELRYYASTASTAGLVVLSIESPGPLTHEEAREWQSVLSCMNLSFQ